MSLEWQSERALVLLMKHRKDLVSLYPVLKGFFVYSPPSPHLRFK